MELIDKDTNVWAKSITELSTSGIKNYLDTYADAPLMEFAFEYDGATDEISVLKEHPNFEFYAYIVPKYLKADETVRQIIKSKCDFLPENNFDVLDMVIKDRACKKIMRMLGEQSCDLWINESDILDFIGSSGKPKYLKVMDIFNYGVIKGKQLERQKKKGRTNANTYHSESNLVQPQKTITF